MIAVIVYILSIIFDYVRISSSFLVQSVVFYWDNPMGGRFFELIVTGGIVVLFDYL
jgi:hypothetical protein